jgi:hypothetical protein
MRPGPTPHLAVPLRHRQRREPLQRADARLPHLGCVWSFRNRGTVSLSASGVTRTSGGAARRRDRARLLHHGQHHEPAERDVHAPAEGGARVQAELTLPACRGVRRVRE